MDLPWYVVIPGILIGVIIGSVLLNWRRWF